ncbi:ferredoxin [Pseudarthrobacter sulfonivorans]|uniref:ferredoxin n=1 Tax=Pseudarthrobacter sulfonivorans TaxID=121292 RepID=UPI00168BD9F7|nr:ferredoxin [Pseudarthrobacter sulfonivorans]
MKVSICEAKCIGAGVCVDAAEEVFSQRDEDGIAIVLDAEPRAELHAAVREAAVNCPAGVIEIQE